jgi:CubicO group peptidase (beta-lactamase class C family)
MLLFAVIATTLAQSSVSERIDAAVMQVMSAQNIPGMAVSIVKGGTIAFARGYGLADRERNIPVTPETRFQIASTSKAITAVAVMQLVEEGRIALSDDIGKFLNFTARNPRFASTPITVEMLLAHSSSIEDGPNLFDFVVPGDSPIQLGDFVRRSLQTSGDLYERALEFGDAAPGARFKYANMNTAILGYIVELVSGQPFNQRCNQTIFTPLCMTRSRWFLSELDSSDVARPYKKSGSTLEPRPYTGFPDYPDGQLRSNVLDLSKFLWAFLNGGVPFAGARALQSATITQMTRVRPPATDMGLHLFSDELDGNATWGHAGGLDDASSELQFSPEDGVGVSILVNTGAEISNLRNQLLRLARELPANPRNPIQCNLATSVRLDNTPRVAGGFALEIQPNPASDVLVVTTQERGVSLRLMDALGQTVLVQDDVPTTRSEFSISRLARGAYFVVVLRNGAIAGRKQFIKF